MRVGLIPGIAAGRRARRSSAAKDDDGELVARLRAGDEQAFVLLVARHHSAMVRLARTFVPSTAVAEEVVQDTWVGVVRGIDRFAGRSTFKTWLLTILVNRARSTGVREHRSVAIGDGAPAVERSRFDSAGAWMSPPQHWIEDSDERILAEELTEPHSERIGRAPGAPARGRNVARCRGTHQS